LDPSSCPFLAKLISNQTNLIEVDLSHNRLCGEWCEKLRIYGEYDSTQFCQFIQSISGHPSLTFLDFSFNYIQFDKHVNAVIVEAFSRDSTLQYINLLANQSTENDINLIPIMLSQCLNIKSFIGNSITTKITKSATNMQSPSLMDTTDSSTTIDNTYKMDNSDKNILKLQEHYCKTYSCYGDYFQLYDKSMCTVNVQQMELGGVSDMLFIGETLNRMLDNSGMLGDEMYVNGQSISNDSIQFYSLDISNNGDIGAINDYESEGEIDHYSINIILKYAIAFNNESHLTHLNLSNTGLRPIDADHIRSCLTTHRCKLRVLDISFNKHLKLRGITSIAQGIGHNTSLVKLVMMGILNKNSPVDVLSNAFGMNKVLCYLSTNSIYSVTSYRYPLLFIDYSEFRYVRE
jgi:hypothetical protein